MNIHVANISLFKVSPNGRVYNSTSNTASIKDSLRFRTEHRVVYNTNIPNSINNPTITDYLNAEAASGFAFNHIDQSYLITVSGASGGGGNTNSINTVSSNYSINSSSDYTILVDATSGNVTVTLPLASGNSGKIFNIKKIDSSGHNVIIDGNGSLIDNSSTQTINTQYQSYSVQCNDVNWFLI